jgi:hypothetical protein
MRNRYERSKSSAWRMTTGLLMPLQQSMTPKTTPITAPATRVLI